jgi:TM2 domain-containing membrane protein YozV
MLTEFVVNRIKDPSAIEARLLELAHTTDAKITAPAVAYFAPCSIEDAARVLDDLTARDQLSMEIEDDGTIVYQMRGRQKLATPRPAPEPHPGYTPLRRETALVPIERYRGASPMLAAVLTMFIPGAGHLYAGRFVSAMLWFVAVGLGYALILPGLVLHLLAIVSAASAAHQLNVAPRRLQLSPARGF